MLKTNKGNAEIWTPHHYKIKACGSGVSRNLEQPVTCKNISECL